MSTSNLLSENQRETRPGLVGGLILILIGLFALADRFLGADLGMLFLPGLGLIFLTAALLSRRESLLVPGGILSGIGLGSYLVSGPFEGLAGAAPGGIFLLSFAAGWALIVLLSALFFRVMWWPLVPGGIMAFIGALLLSGSFGLQLLEVLGLVWPVFLIAAGLLMLIRRH